jgi:aarF domain-containing kinase
MLVAPTGLALALHGLTLRSGCSSLVAQAEQNTVRSEPAVPPPSLMVDGRPSLYAICKLIQRCAELFLILGPTFAAYLLQRTPLLGLIISRETLLSMFVSALARCGPVGIKWGQWASTRYDLFDDETCAAMGALTNKAPTHSFEWSRHVIETSFGRPLDDLFESFDMEALASGSIGQVHTATLRSDGTRVAVKVQHPHLGPRLAVDMFLLRAAADLVSSFAPALRVGETADQFATNFEMQLDFRDEAAFLRKFSSNFSGSFWTAHVTFPKPMEDLIAHDVLVETFEPGESIAMFLERKGERKAGQWKRIGDGPSGWVMVDYADEKEETEDDSMIRMSVALCGIQAYLKMVIFDNLIHADLHPGNVLVRMADIGPMARLQRWVLMGDYSPRVPHIVFLDAGLAAGFNDDIFANVQRFFEAIVACEGRLLGESVLKLAPTQPHVRTPSAFVGEFEVKCAAQKAEFDAGDRHPQQPRDAQRSQRFLRASASSLPAPTRLPSHRCGCPPLAMRWSPWR